MSDPRAWELSAAMIRGLWPTAHWTAELIDLWRERLAALDQVRLRAAIRSVRARVPYPTPDLSAVLDEYAARVPARPNANPSHDAEAADLARDQERADALLAAASRAELEAAIQRARALKMLTSDKISGEYRRWSPIQRRIVASQIRPQTAAQPQK